MKPKSSGPVGGEFLLRVLVTCTMSAETIVPTSRSWIQSAISSDFDVRSVAHRSFGRFRFRGREAPA